MTNKIITNGNNENASDAPLFTIAALSLLGVSPIELNLKFIAKRFPDFDAANDYALLNSKSSLVSKNIIVPIKLELYNDGTLFLFHYRDFLFKQS